MAAQHAGTCQICGREHKVTKNRIAKHGFTIRHGWQEGACFGSGGKPYELSCDLLPPAIESAKRYIEKITASIAHLKAHPLDVAGMVFATIKVGNRFSTQSKTVPVKPLDVDGKLVFQNRDGETVTLYSRLHPNVQTAEQAARALADRRIEGHQYSIKQTKESITYMEQRVKDWKPVELRLLTDAETNGNKPRVHFQKTVYGYKSTACSASAMGAQRNRSANKTTDESLVTCAGCLKDIEQAKARAAKKAVEAAAQQ